MARTSGTRSKGNGLGQGPGQGPGWGGPARGAHPAIDSVPVLEAVSKMAQLRIDDPEAWALRQAKNVVRKERGALLENELFDIAMDSDQHPATRVQAIDKALDRLQGKPVQRTELTGADGEALKIEGVRRVIVDPQG